MLKTAARQQALDSALPPLPPEHDFHEGDRVTMPVFPSGLVSGTVKHIDVLWRSRRYVGLVVVDADGCCYELRPEIARRITP
jgi:hypothetical protein